MATGTTTRFIKAGVESEEVEFKRDGLSRKNDQMQALPGEKARM